MDKEPKRSGIISSTLEAGVKMERIVWEGRINEILKETITPEEKLKKIELLVGELTKSTR